MVTAVGREARSNNVSQDLSKNIQRENVPESYERFFSDDRYGWRRG
jgi:hypothetical protein